MGKKQTLSAEPKISILYSSAYFKIEFAGFTGYCGNYKTIRPKVEEMD